MADVLKLLETMAKEPASPVQARDREKAWAIVSSGQVLFDWLTEKLRAYLADGHDQGRLDIQKAFGLAAEIDRLARSAGTWAMWGYALALIDVAHQGCADVAKGPSDPLGAAILQQNRSRARARVGAENSCVDDAWMQVALYSLLENAGLVDRPREPDIQAFPVAFVRVGRPQAASAPSALDQKKTTNGLIAYLVLERLPGGSGGIAQHPKDLFQTVVESELTESLKRAWAAAGGGPLNAQAVSGNYPFDGRWRVVYAGSNGRWVPELTVPLPEIGGDSISAAANRGWEGILAGLYPDAEILVVAVLSYEPSRGYFLSKVADAYDKLKDKIEAALEAPHIDTIIIVRDNVEAAEKALGELNQAYRLEDSKGRPFGEESQDTICCIRLTG